MLIEKFIEYLRVEKNYSNHTITAYKTELNNFNDFLIQSDIKTKMENIDYKVIRSWIVKMVNDPEKTTKMGKAAKTRIENKLSSKQTVIKLKNHYEKTLLK